LKETLTELVADGWLKKNTELYNELFALADTMGAIAISEMKRG
jgi:hypothetical protein